MSNKTALHRPILLPCEVISVEIGQVGEQLLHPASATEKKQLEHILLSLQTIYEQQCEGKHPARAERAAVQMNIVKDHVLLSLVEEHGNGVRVIMGGNDGILVTIDGQGHVTVRPPEGPGDPEIRQAISQIVKGVQVLAGQVAAGAAH